MSAIGPGDWVECVASDAIFGVSVTLGAIYRCTETEASDGRPWPCTAHGSDCPGGAIRVAEAPLPVPWWWCSDSFRPIYRPDETLTARLLEPLPDALAPTLPERVSEPAAA